MSSRLQRGELAGEAAAWEPPLKHGAQPVRVVDFRGLKTEIGSVDFYTQNPNPNPQVIRHPAAAR